MKTKIKLKVMAAFSAVLMCICSNVTNAQETTTKEVPENIYTGEFGLRFYPTFSSMTFNTHDGGTVRADMTLSLGYGGMFAVNLNNHVGLQAEVDYLSIMQKYKDRDLERQVNI